jgi:predicted amino acid dehydrogenase
MQANIWEATVSVCDWRTWKRILYRQSQIDVVFISNLRDDVDRQRYIGNLLLPQGHVNGARLNIQGIIGRMRWIDVDSSEILSPSGRKKAKKQFILAAQWAADRGAKVILLAAATKRLFGQDGDEIIKMFPDIIFTIGDNGTAYLLIEEVFSALRSANLAKNTARIAVLGPYGILGNCVVNALVADGYKVLGVGSNIVKLEELATSQGIETTTNLNDLNNIDMVVACTHSKKTLLTSQIVEKIKRPDKKVIVIDVAEPSNFVIEEYQACRELAIRQDAGNGYSANLKYVLGSLSYKMLRLTDGVIFGCFAEALSIAYCLNNGDDVCRDWFNVNPENIEFTRKMFEKVEFTVPQTKCFGEIVDSLEP